MYIHTFSANAVTLVWGSLRLAPIRLLSCRCTITVQQLFAPLQHSCYIKCSFTIRSQLKNTWLWFSRCGQLLQRCMQKFAVSVL